VVGAIADEPSAGRRRPLLAGWPRRRRRDPCSGLHLARLASRTAAGERGIWGTNHERTVDRRRRCAWMKRSATDTGYRRQNDLYCAHRHRLQEAEQREDSAFGVSVACPLATAAGVWGGLGRRGSRTGAPPSSSSPQVETASEGVSPMNASSGYGSSGGPLACPGAIAP
jgi:hypothetical protein